MFKRVLVPIDSSKSSLRALKPAKAFADKTGAELVVATVLFTEAIDEEDRRQGLRQRTVDVGVEPDDVIVRLNSISVENGLHDLMDDATLVVLSSPGHSHTQRFLGNVSEEIVHHRPAGLSVIVGPEVDVDTYVLEGAVFGCVDPGGEGDRLLAAVERVSKELALDPWLISVGEEMPVPSKTGAPGLDHMPLETNQLRSLAHELQERDTATVNYDVLHSDHPAKEIAAYAARHGAALLAVSTRERSPLDRLLFGSVAIDIVKRASVPVLAVHRKGSGR
ncbi:MAG: universal stress protein [Acidimicrobiales bacterium]|nr:universal stress protein [Acidimicrobiales bacterium]